jgi:putative Holliday junction resolvase
LIYQDIASFRKAIIAVTLKGMAIDYGTKKSGIAICDAQRSIAMPLCSVMNGSTTYLLQQISKIVARYEIGFIVLGFPDSSYDSSIYKAFANQLLAAVNTPIYLQDETYSSRIADEMLQDLGLNRKKRNSLDDQIAAQVIMEHFLAKLHLC